MNKRLENRLFAELGGANYKLNKLVELADEFLEVYQGATSDVNNIIADWLGEEAEHLKSPPKGLQSVPLTGEEVDTIVRALKREMEFTDMGSRQGRLIEFLQPYRAGTDG